MRLAAKLFALRNQSTRRVWAMAALVLFLTLQLFASSEALHHSLHCDANLPTHHCVVTLLSHGQVSAAGCPIGFVSFVAAMIFLLPLLHAAANSPFDYRLSPSRAPPRF